MISKILQDKERFILITLQDQSLKRAHFLHHPELDNALANWVLQMEHRKIRINDDIIKEKGRQFAQALSITNPSAFSNGWLQSFKERHSFRQYHIHDENEDAEIFNIDIILTTIKEKIAQYQSQDVYNMNEIGLFYNLASDITISH